VFQGEGGVARQVRQAGLVTPAVRLLGRVTIGDPHLRDMPAHDFVDHAGGAGIVGLMNDGVLAMEHPLIGIGPLDAYAGFVAGDDLGRAKAAAGLVRFAREPWPRAGEHVHQRPFADLKAEGVAEHEPQPLVGQGLEGLVVDRQGVNARTKRGFPRDGRRRSLGGQAAVSAPAGVTAMAHDVGLDRRNLDLVIFADQLFGGVRAEPAAALFADLRPIIAEFIGMFRQRAVMRLMTWLGAAGSRPFPLRLLVRRRRLGGIARGLLRPLQPQNQFDQLLLAEPLQITPFHSPMDSDIYHPGKGAKKGGG